MNFLKRIRARLEWLASNKVSLSALSVLLANEGTSLDQLVEKAQSTSTSLRDKAIKQANAAQDEESEARRVFEEATRAAREERDASLAKARSKAVDAAANRRQATELDKAVSGLRLDIELSDEES